MEQRYFIAVFPLFDYRMNYQQQTLRFREKFEKTENKFYVKQVIFYAKLFYKITINHQKRYKTSTNLRIEQNGVEKDNKTEWQSGEKKGIEIKINSKMLENG